MVTTMTERFLRFAASGLLAILLNGHTLNAECITVPINAFLDAKGNELIFSGTVVEIVRTAPFGYRATFEVDQVWKGVVSKRIDLYVWELPAETPRFGLNRHYLVVAKRLVDPLEREGVGLGGSDMTAFAGVQCSPPEWDKGQMICDLGRGQPPK
jgi:hypothetical protein